MRQVDLESIQFTAPTLDSHFHYQECLPGMPDLSKNLETWFSQGLVGFLDVSITPLDFEKRVAALEAWKNTWMTAGLHPNSSETAHEDLWTLLEGQLSHPKVIAVGEIGLDWFRGLERKTSQFEAFERQLFLAKKYHLPVVIHNRDADQDLYPMIKKADLERGGILHCFSSDWKTAVKFLDLGFVVSFAGNVTYKTALGIQDTCSRLPQTAWLVETDAPYLAPVPHRGMGNHPGYLCHTLEKIAQLRQTLPQNAAAQSCQNFFRFFASVFQDKDLHPPVF